MVRQWLQSNGHEADAIEFDARLTELSTHLREWEHDASRKAKALEATWKAREENGGFLELFDIIGRDSSDALNNLSDEASSTWNYLKQLDCTIREKLETAQKTPDDDYSQPKSPAEWRNIFGVSQTTLRKMTEPDEQDEPKLRTIKDTVKRWRIHNDDIEKHRVSQS